MIDISQGDDLRRKIIPSLLLFLVDKDAFDPDTHNDSSRNPTTAQPAIDRMDILFKKSDMASSLKIPLTKAPREPDYSGSARGVLELMDEPLSKFCTINARIFSYLLTLAGIKSEDIRMVHAVSVDDVKKMCTQKGQQWWSGFSSPEAAVQNKQIGGSGHDLVEVKVDGTWNLVNTRDLSKDYDLTSGFLRTRRTEKANGRHPGDSS